MRAATTKTACSTLTCLSTASTPCTLAALKFILISFGLHHVSYTKQAFTFGTEPDSRFTVELTVLPSASSTFLSCVAPPAPGSAVLPTAPLCVCVCACACACVLCVAAMAPADFDLTGQVVWPCATCTLVSPLPLLESGLSPASGN
jgi:phosphotransferase system  glucose/maltose/N-acetylglucosamine-specific IIC component